MIELDIRTVFFMNGLLYLLLPSVAWAILAGQRSRQVALWCGGGLVFGSGTVLAGMHGWIPEWASLSVPILLAFVSYVARIQSLLLDQGRPWRLRWMVSIVAVAFLVSQWLHFGLGRHGWRAEFFSVVSAAGLLYLARLAWCIGRDENSRSARWIAWVYGVVGAALIFRAFQLHGVEGEVTVMNSGLASSVLALTLLASSVIGHFGYVGLALDRSTRRELDAAIKLARDEESLRLGEQIARLDRQRTLGEMSASLGHELNQPLTAIRTNAQVAQRGLQIGRFDAAQITELLAKIIHNTERATQVIERIRNFIRPSAAVSEPVDLDHVVHEVVELVTDEAAGHRVRIEIATNPLSMRVSGDPIQLSQIVLNVLRNAIEALTSAERREIKITGDRVDNRAILRIRDTGPGFTPEALAQAGTPFFTTKPTGLGMGISISRTIAAQHGGTLTLRNGERGSIIELTLPAATAEV